MPRHNSPAIVCVLLLLLFVCVCVCACVCGACVRVCLTQHVLLPKLKFCTILYQIVNIMCVCVCLKAIPKGKKFVLFLL